MEAMTREELNQKNMLILSRMKEYFDKTTEEEDKAKKGAIVDILENYIKGVDPEIGKYFYSFIVDSMDKEIYKYIITHYTEDVDANMKLAAEGKKPYYFIFTEYSDYKDVNYLFYIIRQELITRMKDVTTEVTMPPIETLNAYLSYQATDDKEAFLDDANSDYYYKLFDVQEENLTNNQVNEESEEPESGAPGR